ATCYGFFGYVVSTDFSVLAFGLGATLLLMALYTTIGYSLRKLATKLAVVALSMLALINTHTIMALTLLITLVAVWLVEKLNRVSTTTSSRTSPVSTSIVLLFGVSLFSWCEYVSGSLTYLAVVVKWGLRYERF